MKKLMSILLILAVMVAATGVISAQDDVTRLRVTFAWPTFIDPAVGNDFSSSTSCNDTIAFLRISLRESR